jgi:hypothetical protein
MKNIDSKELLELRTVQQSFAELMSAMSPAQFLSGLNDLAWLMASTEDTVSKDAANALFPIMYFFIALAEAEKQIWKDMCEAGQG